MEHTGDEVKRLQGCINDLIGVLALPVLWSGHELAQVVSTLLDAVVGMLRLDFAYARLSDSLPSSPIEMVRTARRGIPAVEPHAFGQAVNASFKDDPSMSPRVMANPIGEGHVSMAPLRFGLDDSVGIFVAGSQRSDFPTSTETLLLRVAVNQAAVALHEARILSEQKRAAEELEQKVVERTADLIVLNEELKIEIADRERAEEESLALKDELAAELSAMIRLHEFSTRLIITNELQPLLDELLNATIALQNADFGNIQLYNPQTRALEIVAQRGFHQDSLEYFSNVRDEGAACGRALQRRERVIIEDVQSDPAFEPHRHIAACAGFRAVQSTPLFTRSGESVGMLSTHFRAPHRPSDRELRFTDLYVMQAVEMIELKRAEEALRESEERFRLMVEGVHDYAMFLLDPEGRVNSWNPGAERIKGYRQDEILGQHFSRFYPDEDVAENKPQELMRVAAATGRSVDEGWRVRKDGTRFWASVLVTALRNNAGELVGFSKLTRDMSERKCAAEALEKAHAELARVMRVTTLGELTASIAHEISQPLTGAVTNGNACLRWLARPNPELAEARAAVERMIRDVNRAADVIRRIRSLAQKSELQKLPLDANDIIHEVLSFIESEACRSKVTLRTELSAELPPVLGDRVQLQQVLLNLIINGIESMHSVVDRPRLLLLRSESRNSYEVLVSVRDTGTGLDPQNGEKIFSAFYTTKAHGIGMGLSISHSIIEAHSGRLWATQNDGPGATFQFTLPVAKTGAP
jgi:PAS domain S-box-containing protein